MWMYRAWWNPYFPSNSKTSSIMFSFHFVIRQKYIFNWKMLNSFINSSYFQIITRWSISNATAKCVALKILPFGVFRWLNMHNTIAQFIVFRSILASSSSHVFGINVGSLRVFSFWCQFLRNIHFDICFGI